ncbi:2OG-Fe(II) oxygenase [Kordiimonas pumila]|uniref:2OG-Fe(II) oxygenase n=1 Tax=Kordiimonas pumila TaxID=2161677 RepID=A0ABV7D2I2_9PROT|nr:2OG-Fe(II) oxygenase [Kordiimonas pumila]
MGDKDFPSITDSATCLPWATSAPYFTAPTTFNKTFDFSSLGGRFIILVFLGSSQTTEFSMFKNSIKKIRSKFSGVDPVLFGVTSDPADLNNPEVLGCFPNDRLFLDCDWEVAAKYRVYSRNIAGDHEFCPFWYIIDPMLRVYTWGTLHNVDRLIKSIEVLPSSQNHTGVQGETWAPVLLVPRVLPRDFCQKLIKYYKDGEPGPSGFMQSIGGRTVGKLDPSFKRRKDITITDQALKNALRNMIDARLVPEIKKSFQFKTTRIERSIVACYDDDDKGFFRAHRDNTTSGTMHRRFAVTINLNSEEYDGGELRFPEFGRRLYKAPTGGAIVFSCSLLHEATPVTRGVRYATLPFLYGDEDAAIKEKNSALIDGISKKPNI